MTSTKTLPQLINPADKRLIEAMNVLADPTRYKMFKLLLAGEKICVSEMARQLQVSAPAISQHFLVFERSGLITRERSGQRVCYVLDQSQPFIKQFIAFMQTVIN